MRSVINLDCAVNLVSTCAIYVWTVIMYCITTMSKFVTQSSFRPTKKALFLLYVCSDRQW